MNDARPKIVVCDDNRSRVKHWAQRIEQIEEAGARYQVDPLEPEAFAAAYADLRKRQRARRFEETPPETDAASVLDGALIVVVDYDLTPTTGADELDDDTLDTLSGSFGDTFAFLTRCYTRAGYTVLVNQDFYQSTFDLSHQKFAYSNADLNVAHNDLGRHELWTGVSNGNTFRPWNWPRLVEAPDKHRKLASNLDLEAPVLETLGLADEETYSQFAPEQLVLFGTDPKKVTFREAADFTRKLNRLSQPERFPEESLAKVAVASVSHWLERVLIPAQNVVVDAPHLAHRRPGLLRVPDPTQWTPLTNLAEPAAAVALFDQEQVGAAQVAPLDDWVSRPVWLWHKCPRSRGRAAGIPTAFCEDVSGFHPIEDAWEYTAAVPGPFKQRFVLYEGVEEQPGALEPEYWPHQSLFAHDEAE